jgi:hypothetical protein
MPPDPFPGRRQDGEEPEGSGPLHAGGNGSGAGDGEAPPEGSEQGLFVCLPAEELSLAGFAQDGRTDTMAPGPLLAAVLYAVTGEDGAGLAGLSDDQLTGVMSAVRRLESRAAWTLMAAMREFARRRPAADGAAGFDEFAADELTGTLHLTCQSAAAQIDYACAVAARLPRTFAALASGQIHPVHVRIIEDETRILSAADAAIADEQLAEAAASKTFGQLRYAAHQLVLTLDPDVAHRRRETARQDAHVRRFREDSGNAGMIAREMPPDEVLASWQHVEQRALDLRAAGVPGTLQDLRVRAYLDLLQERDSRQALVGPYPGQAGNGQDVAVPEAPEGPEGPEGPESNDDPGDPPDGPGPRPGPDGTSPGGGARRDEGPSLAALVTITVPLAALQGDTGPPGEVAGFGLLDHQTARDLATAASRHPRTRWCLTALHPDGTAGAHGCAAGPRPWPPEPPGPLRPAAPQDAEQFLRALKLTLNIVIRGPCTHAQAEHRYRPSRQLRHLIGARSTRCTAPGCGRPAARCDLDHTTPWHHGGKTCPCNLAPLCRHHHRCKQAEGWRLEQPEPGVLVWRTPSGRTYTSTPTVYPI